MTTHSRLNYFAPFIRFPESKVSFLLILSLLFSTVQSSGQVKAANPEYERYFNKYTRIAIDEMRQYGIPASIILAQGVLESDCGRSKLAVEANNHFGIKCHDDWQGPTFTMDDDAKNECFRKYDKAEDSFRDHSLFLSSKSRYASLFKLDGKDYSGWAWGLKSAGYASNIQYPQLLIKIIEDNKLYLLDDNNYRPGIAENRTSRNKNENQIQDSYQETSLRYREISRSRLGRPLLTNNNIPFVFAKKGDSFKTLASEFRIFAFQIIRYNDMNPEDELKPGQFVYLEPKKRTGDEKFHTVKPNEDLWQISQFYGIKLKKLARFNHLQFDDRLSPGQVVRLSR